MKARDLSVVFGVILIIIMLVIPLPGWLLSILILCNISLALIVILVSMNTQEPLQFSIFSSLLLLFTLFRLGLIVSTTRSILSYDDVGVFVFIFCSFIICYISIVGYDVFFILLALIVILVLMNIHVPLQFSIFPSLLLLLTLFRLCLNVSTTRSILSEADAGGVVDTFGSFVIGDNPLVGFVVFIILVII